jgi:pimeloyl-ACP methyl ester carboxylesterase
VFDRPGFGHSSRPRNVLWSPEAHDLFAKALDRLNVPKAIVLGHSWGESVAVASATKHPPLVEALGSLRDTIPYCPRRRACPVGPAIPGLGDIISGAGGGEVQARTPTAPRRWPASPLPIRSGSGCDQSARGPARQYRSGASGPLRSTPDYHQQDPAPKRAPGQRGGEEYEVALAHGGLDRSIGPAIMCDWGSILGSIRACPFCRGPLGQRVI